MQGTSITGTATQEHDMEHMDTMTDAINRLEADGFTAQFMIHEDGGIVSDDGRWAASDVEVERTIRFEGMSNPDDESMVMAIQTSDGTRGTLVLPYGPDVSGDQADTIRALAMGG